MTGDPDELDTSVLGAMLRLPCDYCNALPGDWCATRSGTRAVVLHAARWWRWKQGRRITPDQP